MLDSAFGMLYTYPHERERETGRILSVNLRRFAVRYYGQRLLRTDNSFFDISEEKQEKRISLPRAYYTVQGKLLLSP